MACDVFCCNNYKREWGQIYSSIRLAKVFILFDKYFTSMLKVSSFSDYFPLFSSPIKHAVSVVYNFNLQS